MSAAAAAFVPTFISFDDDDFGEFEFAASPASASPPPPPPPPNDPRSNQKQCQKTAGDEDDDWGDFVEGPFQSPAPIPPSTSFFDPFPGTSATEPDLATAHTVPPVSAEKEWCKPSGALPLSLFGEEDEDDEGGDELSLDPQISALAAGTFPPSKTVGSKGVASAQGEGLKDLIVSLYGLANNVGSACAGSNNGSGEILKVHRSNGAKSDFSDGADEEDEFNENSWEFKDALDTPFEDAGDCVLVEKEVVLAGVPRAEVKADDKGSGLQANGQKCNDLLRPNLPTKVLSNEGEWRNAFVSHNATINGFEAGSAHNGCNGSSTNGRHDFEHIIIENGLSPSTVSGDTCLYDSFWEFKGVSSNRETLKHSAEPEKEGKLAGISAIEEAMYNFTASQHSDDCQSKANGKKFNTFGTNLPSTALIGEGEWGNAFISHDAVINGSDVGSVDNGCNGSMSDACHNVEPGHIENMLSPNLISEDMNPDDSCWEFKDASSVTRTLRCFTESESIVHAEISEQENLQTSTCNNGNQNVVDSLRVAEGLQYECNSIVNGSENAEPCSAVGLNNLALNICNEPSNKSTSKQTTLSSQDSAVSNETLKGADNIDLKHAGLRAEVVEKFFKCENMDDHLSFTEPERIVDFYSKLKQKSYTLALHHFENIKRANQEEAPGEEPKVGYVDGEIKAAFSKLGIVATESDYLEKSPDDLTVYDLLEVLQNPCFQAFDVEYSLSAKIQLAAKDWTSAIWLLEHASCILRILRLASYEEQRTYIVSWSKIVAACEKELQHGAVIWSKARHPNIQKELLSKFQGQQYFLALGEIYRVIEILSASVRLYKPWIFYNPVDLAVFLNCMKKSQEAWNDLALKQALEIISESSGEQKVVAEELLASLTYISQLSIETLQSHLPNHETHCCRLSLLPLQLLPDIKHLVWQGDHYFSILANLWANRVSCDAPQLPHIQVGQ